MDDKTKKILKAVSPIYAMSQGSLPGLLGVGADAYKDKKDKKKKEALEKLEAEKLAELKGLSGAVPVKNQVAKTAMSHGGRVRGSGIAKKGVRACKMR